MEVKFSAAPALRDLRATLRIPQGGGEMAEISATFGVNVADFSATSAEFGVLFGVQTPPRVGGRI